MHIYIYTHICIHIHVQFKYYAYCTWSPVPASMPAENARAVRTPESPNRTPHGRYRQSIWGWKAWHNGKKSWRIRWVRGGRGYLYKPNVNNKRYNPLHTHSSKLKFFNMFLQAITLLKDITSTWGEKWFVHTTFTQRIRPHRLRICAPFAQNRDRLTGAIQGR